MRWSGGTEYVQVDRPKGARVKSSELVYRERECSVEATTLTQPQANRAVS